MNQKRPRREGRKNRPYTTLTLTQQKEIIDFFSQNKSIKWIMEKTGLLRSTVTYVGKRKDKILKTYSKGINCDIKKIRNLTHPQLEDALLYWFWQDRILGEPISTDALQQKAKFFHSQICDDAKCTFTASNGWVMRFKIRNKIPVSAKKSESANVREVAEELFRKTVISKVTELGLRLDQVYCVDEINLYWRKLPLEFIDERSSKDKVSMIACSNVTGTNRTPLQIISRPNKPLLLQTSWSQAGRIFCTKTKCIRKPSDLLKSWFKDFFVPSVTTFSDDREIPAKALLLINSTNQMVELDTEHIKILVIPFNLSQLCQPIFQPSITLPLRTSYRKHLLQQIVSNDTNWMENLMNLEIQDVYEIINENWINLSNESIFDAWDKLLTGFEPYEMCFGGSDDSELNDQLEEIIEMLKSVKEFITLKELLEWIQVADSHWNDHLSDEKIIEFARELLKTSADDSLELAEDETNDNFVGVNEDSVTFGSEEDIVLEENTPKKEREVEIIEEEEAWKHFNGLINFFKQRNDSKKLAAIKKLKNEFLDDLKTNEVE